MLNAIHAANFVDQTLPEDRRNAVEIASVMISAKLHHGGSVTPASLGTSGSKTASTKTFKRSVAGGLARTPFAVPQLRS